MIYDGIFDIDHLPVSPDGVREPAAGGRRSLDEHCGTTPSPAYLADDRRE